MSTNCLITKFNGSVQNENLPVFDKIMIDLKSALSGGRGQIGFTMNGDNSQKTKVTVAEGATLTPFEGSITDYNFHTFVGRIQGSSSVDKALVLDNVYNFKTFLMNDYATELISNYGNMNALLSSNIKLLGVMFDSANSIKIPKNCKAFYVVVKDFPIFDYTNLLGRIDGIDNIKFLSTFGTSLGIGRLDCNSIPSNVRPQAISNFVLTGNIGNLPNTVEYIHVHSVSTLSGAVEDFIQNSGKSDGQMYIYISGRGSSGSVPSITLMGSPIVDSVVSSTCVKISWGSGSSPIKEVVTNAVLNGVAFLASNFTSIYMANNTACLNYIDSLYNI